MSSSCFGTGSFGDRLNTFLNGIRLSAFFITMPHNQQSSVCLQRLKVLSSAWTLLLVKFDCSGLYTLLSWT
jgi:hypothetical protein